ncbi:MAG: glycosyltransferase, partial [Steroidobacteraceae bacterium]
TGKLVPRLDLQALTHALREMSADRATLRAMGKAARTRAQRLLSWERSAERLERLYLGLLAVQPQPRGPLPATERSPFVDIA